MYFSKNKDWIILNLPCFVMFATLIMSTQYSKDIFLYSGYIAAILLIFLLSLNPFIRRFNIDFLRKVNRYRRIIGVAVFSYASLHVMCYIAKKGISISALLKSPVLSFGALAFIILIPLAITSNNFSIKKLTLPTWRKLHKYVYLAEGALFLHLALQFVLFDKTRPVYILSAFILLFILQILRLRMHK
jgi:sulfoxide reductase heme-binding subunit YedZ